MGRHLARAAFAQGNHQEMIHGIQNSIEFPPQFLQCGSIKATAKNTVLDAVAVAFQGASHFSEPLSVANVIADQMPMSCGHRRFSKFMKSEDHS
jgi:hypothetical protein